MINLSYELNQKSLHPANVSFKMVENFDTIGIGITLSRKRHIQSSKLTMVQEFLENEDTFLYPRRYPILVFFLFDKVKVGRSPLFDLTPFPS